MTKYTNKYGIGPGHAVMASFIEPGNPEVEVLRDMVIRVAMLDEYERNNDALRGLVDAYTALLTAEADEHDVELDTVHDGDTYEAEKVYLKYALAGYRYSMPERKGWSDNDLMEYISWYTFPKMWWPTALLAEVGFMRGSRDAKEAKAMFAYFAENRAG